MKKIKKLTEYYARLEDEALELLERLNKIQERKVKTLESLRRATALVIVN